jgi:uncharacterized membrane protein (DUF2068 family)
LAISRQVDVRAIAMFEGTKGVVALMAATGIMLHHRLESLVDRFASHLYLNPGHARPRAIVQAIEAEAGSHLRILALGTLLYAAMRLIEAGGLWRQRRWALWFGALSGAVYLPLDVVALVRRPEALTAALLVLNVAVVSALGRRVTAPQRTPVG